MADGSRAFTATGSVEVERLPARESELRQPAHHAAEPCFHKIYRTCDPLHSRLDHRSDRRSVTAGCTVTRKEGAMPNQNLWNRNVPRIEHDHRARDTRLRLERIERLLVKRDAAGGSQYLRQILLLLGNTAGSGRRRGRRTGSSNDWRPCHIGTPRPTSFVLTKQPAGYSLPSIGA